MSFVELSDLEEGEILEYDSYSPVDSSDDFEIKNRPSKLAKTENSNCHFQVKDRCERNSCSGQQKKHGYLNKNLKEKLEMNGKLSRLHVNVIDLESISSDGEYISDGDGKYVVEQKDCLCNNGEKRGKGKHSTQFYGTVEDIMSEIGETICRKSRCNYKKRKSKDFVKYSDNSYDLWRDKIFSSHLKEKKRKRKVSESNSESEFGKGRVEKRKKRKRKREVYYEECGTAKKKPKARDFDEMRRNLLEKLKKQKAEEALRVLTNTSPPEVDNSEIQEVDMLVDCTNYVDDPSGTVQRNSVNEVEQAQEKEGDDELDLIKLRLIALASNKKGKSGGNAAETEAQKDVLEDGNPKDRNSKEEVDLDRNELLLRAEALKTALLKKHQKRLNKLKAEKSKAVGSSSDNDLHASSSPGQESVASKGREMLSTREGCTEVKRESTSEADGKLLAVSSGQVPDCHIKKKEALVSSANTTKKGNLKVRVKRKKRKSCSLANSLKENSDKSEALEEDDRTLRSQLLSDLMRKKSLKDSEKKPVLMDSIQTSANQIPLPSCESPKENGKPEIVRKNPLKKVNVAKMAKPRLAPKVPVPEIQRIIIHLGSEDSSDENGPTEEKTSVVEKKSEAQESVKVESESGKGKVEKIQEAVQASYEKSVELLLSQARKKIEGKMQSAKNNVVTTPEAVYKHLPPSQRLEYLRLKQKIAERERLRKQRNENSSSVCPGRLETSTPEVSNSQKPGAQSKPENSVSVVRSIGWNNFGGLVSARVPNSKPGAGMRSANGVITRTTGPRLVANKMKNNFGGVTGKGFRRCPVPGSVGLKAPQTSSSLLLPSSQALITKLKLLLKKIKIEKTIEENYEKEISKLKNQLNLFERRKTEQRFKIKKLGEESMKTYRAIQGITAKTSEKALVKEERNKEEKEKKKKKEEEEKKKKEEEERMKKEEEERKKKEEEEKKIEEMEKKKREEEESRVGEPKDEEKQSQEGKKVPFHPEKEIRKVESEIDKELNSGGDVGCGDDENLHDGDDARTSEPVSREIFFFAGLLNYNSPLEVFKKALDCSERVDPNVIMCQFDLMGECKDEECTYQHLRKS